jgi:long-chain fatty acid transport protein
MISKFLYLIIPVILVNQSVFGQGFQVNLQGQRQQAMGGTGTGAAMDAATVFYNPGAMSSVSSNEVLFSANAAIAKSAYLDGNTGGIYRTTQNPSPPFSMYAMWGPKESKLKYGLGVYTPFGSTIQWEEGWTGRFVLTKMSLTSVFIQPTVSYQLSDKIGIGAGFVYGLGMVNLQRDIPVVDANGNFSSAELKGNAHGMGYNIGVYYKPTDKLSIGLTYRSKVKMSLDDGTATFNVPASLNSNFPDGAFSASLPLPSTTSVGVGYRFSEKFMMTFDFNYIAWSVYKSLMFDYANNTSSLPDTDSPRNYKDAYAIRIGTQYMLTEKFAVRLGTAFQKTPIKDGYVTPEIPDADRINLTCGIGYQISEHLRTDASFTYEYFVTREDTNIENNMFGTYKTRIYVPGVSLTYQF